MGKVADVPGPPRHIASEPACGMDTRDSLSRSRNNRARREKVVTIPEGVLDSKPGSNCRALMSEWSVVIERVDNRGSRYAEILGEQVSCAKNDIGQHLVNVESNAHESPVSRFVAHCDRG
jgi:hypothetical protein